MEDGPSSFRPGYTCPALLRCSLVLHYQNFHIRGYHPVSLFFPEYFANSVQKLSASPTTPVINYRFGLFPFRSPLPRESLIYFLFLCLLRCFSSAGLATSTYTIQLTLIELLSIGLPHSDIYGSSLLPARRNFSQVCASFFAYQYQGIHQQPFSA